MNSALIYKYFTKLSPLQKEQFEGLEALYQDWNLKINVCLLYTSPSPRDGATSRMPSSA